ncbi:hypothetical protein H7I53_11770 [Mycolicibacterium pulveris]|uniref:PE-PPE domain-containing protein n=1 Tax=Mycolicibacterium pulveris TaxID=36813 RepID=A0A7I7UGA1_MYCPV|nr:hypothetical protein [Mycolicibacterium pulveris]MCV6980897.1 hypothetical protein [Mycolicibacterium pulveris]BBY80518.1 hypothetical protein MPUL_16760 [Mycolicibacterium pulveris]
MYASTRPLPTKLAAALLAAGLAATGTAVDVPEDRRPTAVTAEVANVSVVTEILYDAGVIAGGAAQGLYIPVLATLSLPFELAATAVVAARSPAVAPSVFSLLVQRYVNPSDGVPAASYPGAIREVLLIFAGVLPPPLATGVGNAINELADAFGEFIAAGLPDPDPGADAYIDFRLTDLGKTMFALNQGLLLPARLALTATLYAVSLPAYLEAAVEVALANPGTVPGLLSGLAHVLLSSNGLLGELIGDLVSPVSSLPGPIGDLASDITSAVFDAINETLSVLPTPINPLSELNAPAAVEVAAAEQVSTSGDVSDEQPAAPMPVSAEVEQGEVEQGEVEEAAEPLAEDELNSPPASTLGLDITPGNKFVPGETADELETVVVTDAAEEPDETVTPDPEPTDDDTAETDSGADEPAGEAA